MTWDQAVILTFGVAGVVLAQIPSLARFACFAGLLGQLGWFTAVSYKSQPGIWLTCVVYALAWGYGLWHHWLQKPVLSYFGLGTATTPSVSGSTGRPSGSRPKLRRVK